MKTNVNIKSDMSFWMKYWYLEMGFTPRVGSVEQAKDMEGSEQCAVSEQCVISTDILEMVFYAVLL